MPEIAKLNTQYKQKKIDMNLKSNLTITSQNDNTKPISISSIYNPSMLFKQNDLKDNNNKNPSESHMDEKNNILITFILQNEIRTHGIKDILRELIKIKHTLKRSSYEIYKIFQYPLTFLKRKFSIKKIHLEAFNTILLKDEFISFLLYNIKQIYKKTNTENVLDLISVIEDDCNYSYKEMTQFDKEISHNFNGDMDFDFLEMAQSFEKENINTTTDENKVSSDIDIDELIKYIDSNDDDNGSVGTAGKKKKKKKRKNKKNANNNSKESIDNEKSNIQSNENDEEFIKFKKEIINSTLESFNCQKIGIKISEQFLNLLKKNSN